MEIIALLVRPTQNPIHPTINFSRQENIGLRFPGIAIVTDEFLDFSASRGNDLRAGGLTDGCKWCLCVSRWKEALLNGKGEGDRMIPK